MNQVQQGDAQALRLQRVFVAAVAIPVLLTTIPMYGISFALAGPEHMWQSATQVYSRVATETYLFRHLKRMTSNDTSGNSKMTGLFRYYWLHPFFAGSSILTSGALLYHMMSQTPNSDQKDSMTTTLLSVTSQTPLLPTFINAVACCSMAYFGGKLVPTMYGNASMRRWTRVQQYLVMSLSILGLMLRLVVTSSLSTSLLGLEMLVCRIQVFVCAWNFTLLACAGILQRVYVLSILPFVMQFYHGGNYKERIYIEVFSEQGKYATMLSLSLAIHLCNRTLQEV
ncbi:expressed unknown protein [Seminavis robusta]|uniref:Uncharacterized protein n=1 Tax=Seminavis robusta TaxID=568900 RepID=A0A9N8E0M6_9STRA|nr:expressed unknown protein [Seminavis robusta]|eukprot:Sro527_g160720.1 n/a (283) ;mRNA; r:42960-43808